MTSFEGSFLGDKQRIGDGAVMECGVCWWTYDPQLGDAVWHVPPNTPFSQLPSHWRCPNCDAAPHQFMTLDEGTSPRPETRQPAPTAGVAKLEDIAERLRGAYINAADAMRSLPVYRDDLAIEVIGIRRCEAGIIAIVTTPWCMNLLLLSEDDVRRREGSSREVMFPSGAYAFVSGHLAGVGAMESCSLFSPMHEFENAAAVTAVAEEAMTALFQPAGRPGTGGMSRRQFLRPGPKD